MTLLRFGLVLAMLVMVAGPVAADIGFPGKKSTRTVTHRIELVVDLPDHVVLVHMAGALSTDPDEASFADFAQTRWLEFVGKYGTRVELSLVPKTLAAKYPTPSELSKAISSATPGVVQRRFWFHDLVAVVGS